MSPRALVVIPDPLVREPLRLCLECEGFHLTIISHHEAALARLGSEPVDLVIADHDGSTIGPRRFCAEIRRRAAGPRPAVLLLIAPAQHATAIELLEEGLDVYLTKPVSLRELVARARALLRRTAWQAAGAPSSVPADEAPVRIGGLDIDRSRRRVCLGGEEVRLTEQEFQLLYFLANRPGRVFDRRALLDALWGDEAHVTPRSVDTLVKRLRQRLRARPHAVDYVQTVRGVGYRFIETGSPAVVPRAQS